LLQPAAQSSSCRWLDLQAYWKCWH
jgi:hypothetical protein